MTQLPLRFFDKAKATQQDIAKLYHKLREFPMFWDDRYKDDPYAFGAMFMAANTNAFVFGEFDGIIYFSNILKGGSANASIAIWNKEYLGKPELALKACAAIMRAHDLHRLDVSTMTINKSAIAFAKSVGFVHEGTIRQEVWYNKRWEDLAFMGLLRSELEAKLVGQPIQESEVETTGDTA